jgi:hypothetical protein
MTEKTKEKELTSLEACFIIEGICGYEDTTDEDKVKAFQHLIDTGEINHQQGFYGRTAVVLIDQGLCQPRKVGK